MSDDAPQMWDEITGVITMADSGAPVPGVRVVAMDKDRIRDDKLGEAVSDQDGRYRIEYDPARFGSPLERAPDVYLEVFDEHDTLIASSEQSPIVDAPSSIEVNLQVTPD